MSTGTARRFKPNLVCKSNAGEDVTESDAVHDDLWIVVERTHERLPVDVIARILGKYDATYYLTTKRFQLIIIEFQLA
ncbi:MAG: hypothetical protein GTO41_04750 [Burkholderiales bacterium]|nr:hypothetical protein [Burkholderiales bacterium]